MKKCHYTRKPCMQHSCMLYQQFRGTSPITGEEIDKWECTDVMTPVLMLEMAKQLRSVAASAESSRNVVAQKLDEIKLHALEES